jgi:glycosyltransferase involved in cell wall biosynthesis
VDNLTVVVPFWNGHNTIERLLDSLHTELPVIIVDDDSDEPLNINNRENVTVIRQERGYFSGAVNTGIDACTTDVLVLNQDAYLDGDAWKEVILKAQSSKAAIAGDGVMNHPAYPNGYVQGTFMYLSREAINAIGHFNEEYYPLWGSTAEWQLRACRKGLMAMPGTVPGLQHSRGPRRFKNVRFGSAITEALLREREKGKLFIRTPPHVSVIIPCRNYGRYLPDALASLLGGLTSLGEHPGQSFHSWEAIIVNDQSTDDTQAIIDDLVNPWTGIHSITLNRRGYTPGALNAGIEVSHGRYITILSADDMVEPNHLETLLRTCENNPHRVAHCDLVVFGNGERKKTFKTIRKYDFDRILNKNMISAGVMYPKKCWSEVGGYNPAMKWGREDWCFNVACGAAGWCAVHTGQATYLYRRERQNRSLRTGNTHTAIGEERVPSNFNWLAFFRQQMEAIYPDLYEGERPMACCGGKKKSAPTPKTVGGIPVAQLTGQDGMVILEYVGTSVGVQTWRGPVTQTPYRFGRTRPQGYVDVKDAPGMLDIAEQGARVFRLIRTTPPTVPTPPPTEQIIANEEPTVIEPEPEPVPEPVIEEVVVEEPAYDPSEMTIKEIKALTLTTEQAEDMLFAELEGKSRSRLIQYLEEVARGH